VHLIKVNYLLKLVITSGFITQCKPLGGRTPQTPERISFSVGCLQAAADTKSVEYMLHIRIGTHARGTHAKGRINNQFLITRFSMIYL
jgi:hypothetical protein